MTYSYIGITYSVLQDSKQNTMSYSNKDAMQDTQEMFEAALHSDDMEQVYKTAQVLKNLYGWEEEAHLLESIVHTNNRNDWAYDEAIGN